MGWKFGKCSVEQFFCSIQHQLGSECPRWLPYGCIQLANEKDCKFQKFFMHMSDVSVNFCVVSFPPCSYLGLPHNMVNWHLTWWLAFTTSERCRSSEPHSLKLYIITVFQQIKPVTGWNSPDSWRWTNRSLLQMRRGTKGIQSHVLQSAILTNLECHHSSANPTAPKFNSLSYLSTTFSAFQDPWNQKSKQFNDTKCFKLVSVLLLPVTGEGININEERSSKHC